MNKSYALCTICGSKIHCDEDPRFIRVYCDHCGASKIVSNKQVLCSPYGSVTKTISGTMFELNLLVVFPVWECDKNCRDRKIRGGIE